MLALPSSPLLFPQILPTLSIPGASVYSNTNLMCNSPTDNIVATPTTQADKSVFKKRKNVPNDLDTL